jgi:Na+/H+-dicarboxylate symporter
MRASPPGVQTRSVRALRRLGAGIMEYLLLLGVIGVEVATMLAHLRQPQHRRVGDSADVIAGNEA